MLRPCGAEFKSRVWQINSALVYFSRPPEMPSFSEIAKFKTFGLYLQAHLLITSGLHWLALFYKRIIIFSTENYLKRACRTSYPEIGIVDVYGFIVNFVSKNKYRKIAPITNKKRLCENFIDNSPWARLHTPDSMGPVLIYYSDLPIDEKWMPPSRNWDELSVWRHFQNGRQRNHI